MVPSCSQQKLLHPLRHPFGEGQGGWGNRPQIPSCPQRSSEVGSTGLVPEWGPQEIRLGGEGTRILAQSRAPPQTQDQHRQTRGMQWCIAQPASTGPRAQEIQHPPIPSPHLLTRLRVLEGLVPPLFGGSGSLEQPLPPGCLLPPQSRLPWPFELGARDPKALLGSLLRGSFWLQTPCSLLPPVGLGAPWVLLLARPL